MCLGADVGQYECSIACGEAVYEETVEAYSRLEQECDCWSGAMVNAAHRKLEEKETEYWGVDQGVRGCREVSALL